MADNDQPLNPTMNNNAASPNPEPLVLPTPGDNERSEVVLSRQTQQQLSLMISTAHQYPNIIQLMQQQTSLVQAIFNLPANTPIQQLVLMDQLLFTMNNPVLLSNQVLVPLADLRPTHEVLSHMLRTFPMDTLRTPIIMNILNQVIVSLSILQNSAMSLPATTAYHPIQQQPPAVASITNHAIPSLQVNNSIAMSAPIQPSQTSTNPSLQVNNSIAMSAPIQPSQTSTNTLHVGFPIVYQESKGSKRSYNYLGHSSINCEGHSNESICSQFKEQLKKELYGYNGNRLVSVYSSAVSSWKFKVINEGIEEVIEFKKVAIFKCEGHKQCKVQCLVMRHGDMLGYYMSTDEHIHIDKSHKLSTNLERMIQNHLNVDNAATLIMAQLIVIKDDATLKDYFGENNPNVLSTEDGKDKLRNKIANRIKYLRSRTKNSIPLSANASRTVEMASEDISKSTINLSELIKENSTMSLEAILEILPGDGDFGCYFTSSDVGSVDSGGQQHTVWIKKQAFKTLAAALEMSEKTGLPIMVQDDYTHSKLKIKGGVLGVVGIADLSQQFHPTSFDYNKSENIVGAQIMMEASLQILQLLGHKLSIHGRIYIITDGSDSLRTAAQRLGCIHIRCVIHIFRLPDPSKGKKGFSGTGGSLYRFLKTSGVEERETLIIRLVLYTIVSFPDGHTYRKGREILLFDFNNGDFYGVGKDVRGIIKNHLFKFYLNENPEWGSAATEPGHSTSTNGYVNMRSSICLGYAL